MSTEQRETRATISASKDGPLIVKNLDRLVNSHGEMEVKSTMALCRCGQSGNKPFCDGTHKKVGFSGGDPAGAAIGEPDRYVGRHITILDNRRICAHAGHCTDRLASVFRMRQEPWIEPDGALAKEIMATVDACPSGALNYVIDGAERADPETAATITVSCNGPYQVTGPVELADVPGATARYTLCRCGGSRNKPFCDGSHWDNGFEDDRN